MNYLAHLALSYPDAESAVGNFIADGLRPAQREKLPEILLAGVELHYRIDHYVDRHPAFRDNLKLLRESQGKYAPVCLDIIYDHYLANEWKAFYQISFRDFTKWVYNSLQLHVSSLEGIQARRVNDLLRYRYLDTYSYKIGLRDVLRRMDRRARFPSDFAGAMKVLEEHKENFRDGFRELFTDTRSMVFELIVPGTANSK